MTVELLLVLALLGAAIVMFTINRPRMDFVALLMMVALPLTGVITPSEAIKGFSDPNVVLIATLFVLGEGLVRTGVTQRLGDLLAARAGRSENRLIVFLMLTVAGVGSVMSSTGVVAIFIPIVLRIARSAGIAPSRLMMPLSVAALVSGMMTLVATTPNLVVQAELSRRGIPGLGFFSYTPFGLTILAVAMVYMVITSRWLTRRAPETGTAGATKPARPQLAQWISEYSLVNRAFRLRLSDASPLVGRQLRDLNLRAQHGIDIIAIEREARFGHDIVRPLAQTELVAGDVLFVDSQLQAEKITAFREQFALEQLPLSAPYFTDHSQEIGMAEVMIPASSRLADTTIVGFGFRTAFDLTVIGLKHGKTPMAGNITGETLRVGDTLLVVGPWRSIRNLQSDTQDLLVLNLPVEFDDVAHSPTKAPFAIATLLIVVLLMATGWTANVHAGLIGCLLLGLFRCMDLNSAYRSVHWQSLILIVGMMPFSLALQKTGGIQLAADALIAAAQGVSPRLVLGALFVLTTVLGMFISNTATAILMTPVALVVAESLGMSPYPFAMTVALASSTAFMTPVSSPVNTLVVGPGDYTFLDFVKVGVPLTILVIAVVLLLIPIMLPLYP